MSSATKFVGDVEGIFENQAAPYESTITGDGTTTSFTINHDLGTRNVMVMVRENFNPYEHVQARVKSSSINNVTIETNPALTSGHEYAVLIARAFGGAAAAPGTQPSAHSTSHEVGGDDPIPMLTEGQLCTISRSGTGHSIPLGGIVDADNEIAWNGVLTNPNGWTTTGRGIILPVKGVYVIKCQIGWDAQTGSDRYVDIAGNPGLTFVSTSRLAATVGLTTNYVEVPPLVHPAGQEVYPRAWHAGTAGAALVTGWFSAMLIREVL